VGSYATRNAKDKQCKYCTFSAGKKWHVALHIKSVHDDISVASSSFPNAIQPSAKRECKRKQTESIESGSDLWIFRKTTEGNPKEEKFDQDEKVLVFNGIWMYYATILLMDITTEPMQFLVHYEGFLGSEDQNVNADRMMKITEEVKRIKQQMELLDENGSYYPGQIPNDLAVTPVEYHLKEQVFVFTASDLYGAKILEIEKDDESLLYKVSYNGWRKEFDEYVGSEKIMKRSRTSEEIRLKLKKYKKSPIEKNAIVYIRNKIINQKSSCKRKSNDMDFGATKKEIDGKENENENCNIKSMDSQERPSKLPSTKRKSEINN
jgi:hypothetical protein